MARIEHLSVDVTSMEAARQLRDDNLLLRKDLQAYQDREQRLLSRMDVLEKRLVDIQDKSRSRCRRESDSGSDQVRVFTKLSLSLFLLIM